MTIDIIAIISPKAGKADRVEELIVQTAEKVKANEPGTLRYHLQREIQGDKPVFVMLETYKDKASIDAHGNGPDFKAMGRAMKEEDLLAEPLRIIFTKEAGGYASKL